MIDIEMFVEKLDMLTTLYRIETGNDLSWDYKKGIVLRHFPVEFFYRDYFILKAR